MRAAMYYANDDVRIVDLPTPRIGPGEILVRVKASGICGSDVMEWYRKPKAPLVLGHEIAAEVVQIGAGVDSVKIGDRVFVSHHVPCGSCRYCLAGHETVCETLRTTNFDPGGFAEFVRVPAINVKHGVFPLPREISDDEATFVEPLACVIRGQRLAGFRPGGTILVLGSGVAGLLHIKLAKAAGAAKVIAQGLASVDRGGTVVFFAPIEPAAKVDIPFNALWREEVTLTSSYGGSPRDIRESINLLQEKRIDVANLITHVLPLAKAAEGFRLVAQARDSIKVVLRP